MKEKKRSGQKKVRGRNDREEDEHVDMDAQESGLHASTVRVRGGVSAARHQSHAVLQIDKLAKGPQPCIEPPVLFPEYEQKKVIRKASYGHTVSLRSREGGRGCMYV